MMRRTSWTMHAAAGFDAADALALDRALQKLEALDLTVEESAAALGISPATVKREWALARAWLYRELSGDAGSA